MPIHRMRSRNPKEELDLVQQREQEGELVVHLLPCPADVVVLDDAEPVASINHNSNFEVAILAHSNECNTMTPNVDRAGVPVAGDLRVDAG
eukprot:4844522-Heterocapsa_arctica.AAC.1